MDDFVALAGYDFPPNKACIVCAHIMNGESIMLVSHEDDGDLQFLCGRESHGPDEALVVDIEDVVRRHPDMLQLPTIRMGQTAERAAPNREWHVSQ
jgi:hypothetical protein